MLRNVSRDYLPHFTWSLWDQNVLHTHIDHVFVSPHLMIENFYVRDLPGSDHHAMSFDVVIPER
jgi:endonuclease/exonuclease/phosphatase family metal-dependent hydrolase